MEIRKVVIAGGSGRLGQIMSSQLHSAGYGVTVLTRDPSRARTNLSNGIRVARWTPYEKGDWAKELDSSYAVINLTGADLFGKWNDDYKKEIYDSRIKTTRNLVRAISDLEEKPEVFINGSAVGFYGYDEISSKEHTESSAPADDFFGKLVSDWEKEAEGAADLGIRTSMIRTSVVLSMKGGALTELYRMFRRHLGSYIKPGNQWIPWIHILDEVAVFKFVMEDDSVRGPVNACTEKPVTMRELAATIGKVMKRRVVMGVPESLIRFRMGGIAVLVTRGKKVTPEVLKNSGFKFQFPELEAALADLISKNRY